MPLNVLSDGDMHNIFKYKVLEKAPSILEGAFTVTQLSNIRKAHHLVRSLAPSQSGFPPGEQSLPLFPLP